MATSTSSQTTNNADELDKLESRLERFVSNAYGPWLTKVLRWRPDKEPDQCTFDQLDEPVPIGLDRVLDPET